MPFTPPDMRTVERVAIVKLSAIGDVVHALPVSAALKEAFPKIHLTWIVEQMSAPMVEGNPYLDEVIVLPARLRDRLSFTSLRGFAAVRSDLRAKRFDLALDLQGLSKSALVTWASGARYRFGQDWLRELAPLFETRIPRQPDSVHIVDQLLDTARFLGATVNAVKFPLHIPREAAEAARAMLKEAGVDPDSDYAVYNPSHGGGGFKGWSTEGFVDLIGEINSDPGVPAVLVGSKGDAEIAARISSESAVPITNLVGQTDLKQLAAILRGAALHVCGDTGSAHIAAAFRTPVVTIFGRTDPDRLAPYGFRDYVVHHRERCAPECRRFHQTAPLNRKQKCLSPPPRCMAAVTMPEVASMVRRAMAERRRVPGSEETERV